MAPRNYTLGRRASTATATRERIIEAAVVLYRERGVAGATMQAIAARADVARGTVVNHFGGLDGLLESVLDRATEQVEYPDPAQLSGAASAEARIRSFVDLSFRFFDRSSDWWSVFADDLDLPALKARERDYSQRAARFYEAAFGSIAADPSVAGAVRAFVDFGPLNALRSTGLTLDQAIDLVGDVLIGVVRRRTGEEGGSR